MKPREVDKNTPIWLLQQLWQGSKRLEATYKDHTIIIRRTPKEKTTITVHDNEGVPYELDMNDKEGRRIILHRIWRWQQKTKWRIK